jgi:hypothetical protein
MLSLQVENTAALTPVVIDLQGIKWTLYKGDGEHTIRDLDWAERLKYERPRDIRELIKRMAKAGRLGEVVCRTVRQNTDVAKLLPAGAAVAALTAGGIVLPATASGTGR